MTRAPTAAVIRDGSTPASAAGPQHPGQGVDAGEQGGADGRVLAGLGGELAGPLEERLVADRAGTSPRISEPTASMPPPASPVDLVEVAVRLRQPAARPGRVARSAAPSAHERAADGHRAACRRARPTPRPWPPRRDGRRARRARGPRRRGRGRARAAPAAASASYVAERGAADQRPARPGRCRRRRRPRPARAKCSSVDAEAASVRSAGARCSGSSASAGGDVGQPRQLGRDRRRPGSTARRAAQRHGQERLDHAGAALGAPARPARRRAPRRSTSSPLSSMSQAVRDRQRPRQRVGQAARPRSSIVRSDALVGAHRGEGQVVVVDR